MLKVGIPRALLYYQYYPMWQVFFQELGAQVVTSPPTNREIVTWGCSRIIGDACLPVKVFCGHVLSLVDKCDYIFIPAIHSIEKKVYNCPKFMGLPDLIRASVRQCPPILDPDIDVNVERRELYHTIYKLGRSFTRNPFKVKGAVTKALATHRAYQAQLQHHKLTPAQALAGVLPGAAGTEDEAPSLTVALVGHPYLLYDEHVNHRLVQRLQRMGVKLVFPEMVAQNDLHRSISEVVESQYWTYEPEVIGAGDYYLRNGADGLILVVAFGCGPDSLMAEMLQRPAREQGKPFLRLIIDEHTAETGLLTRLEAFIDMSRRNRDGFRHIYTISSEGGEEMTGIRALGIPNFANLSAAFNTSAKMLNISLIAPPVTKRTLSLGTAHSPEFVCLPFKAILGTFIESLEQGADSLFMVTSSNACRMGYYAKAQERILRDLGYEFRFIKHSKPKSGLPGVLQIIKGCTNDAPWSLVIAAYRLGTAKLKALDDLERAVQKVRPVEREKGTADRIFHETVTAIDQAPELSSLKRVVAEYHRKLSQVARDEQAVPLKVGIIGEVYVVKEPFINMNVEVQLGKLGVEVTRTRSTFFSEWTRPGAFLNALNDDKRKLERFARPYLNRDVGGHGLESVAEKVRHNADFDGMVHLLPFTCMPEVLAQNIMSSTKEDIPVLTILCDEQMSETGVQTRIEAFVDLLEWRRRRRAPR